MTKVIDLTLPIGKHWRWFTGSFLKSNHEEGESFRHTVFTMSAHAFTHVDAPAHFVKGAATIEDVPLAMYSGEAAVVDLTHLTPQEPVTAGELERHAGHVRAGDIAVLRSDWPLRRSCQSLEFWSEAPYLAADACEWLAAKGVKAVGCDFPGDYLLRYEVTDRRHRSAKEDNTTHQLLLAKGIGLIEYLTNLHELSRSRVELYALPLKLVGADGSPVRAIALERDD
ncbi:MAG: cyclase family protein [Chloroflexi bacterium]|nr:cyclase family protein [Chloroflexota bacterium]